ncbi:two-component system sensor histidine kinase NtrB [Vreelandella massiliensis]|uniref:two-component system sensor histidine kinase NtrB n=1 Tax=Vreelandella massiliensis TaxID=1816686 RepID=UPI00096AAE11|nr:PAS domain-containing sensor histidine kinase [Halomonas massiliensis]MYL25113.1 PAS domain S-box protein [Halomonas alkaliantarctica]
MNQVVVPTDQSVTAAPLAPDVLLGLVEQLFGHSPLRVMVTDAEFHVIYANLTSCEHFGYSQEELKALAPNQWRIEPKPCQLFASLKGALSKGQYAVKRLNHCRPDGRFWQEERLWLPLMAVPDNKKRGPSWVLSIGWDIDQRLAAETRAMRSESMRSMLHLMAGLSHEFNNLLGSINGLAELNLMLLNKEHPAHTNSRQMQLAGERAAALIDDMALCAGSVTLDYQRCDPKALMLKALQRALSSVTMHPETRLSFEASPSCVTVDIALVKKSLVELIENALHAMESSPSPCLWLEVGRAQLSEGTTALKLRVGDNGVGMNQHTQTRVFDSFFTTKPPGKGRGLGLVMVNACAVQHGGEVRMTSVPGEGTEVALLLPLTLTSGDIDQ